MTSIPTSSAHLTCRCGAVSVPGSLLSYPELPLSLEICHCNPCRRTSGSLGSAFPILKSGPPIETLSKLTAYRSSEKTVRYFCSKCGCHCFVASHDGKDWFCLGGIIEQSPFSKEKNEPWPKDIIKISRHDYVLDTIDGGFTPFLLDLNGRSIPTWSAAADKSSPAVSFDLPHSSILELPKQSSSNVAIPMEEDHLLAKCHCGGVSLRIKRGNYVSNSGDQFSTRILPSDPTKYLSYLCACRSCRLSTGVSLTAWTLLPPSSVLNANAPSLQPVTFGYDVSERDVNPCLTLKHDWSSPDTCRSFCGVCGATISYWSAKKPEWEIDLAVGIFKAEEGSLARRWLEWSWGQCSFMEECVDEEMGEAWSGSAKIMNEIGG